MNTLIKVFGIFALISLLSGGCAALPASAGQEANPAPKAAVYESILGKPVSDEPVAPLLQV